ncbi:MAG: S49 family peptidase [Paracoccaceae bacterium]|nr:S49 family peptidase [Paracoccaceae bacterium]
MKRWIPFVKSPPVVAVLRLAGTIAAPGRTASLNDTELAPLIERAFRRRKPAAVALVINSPGGSPVQSSLIAARIRRLAEETETPVYAFVEDVAASGGYWLATSGDEIWVDSSSVIGSIGVISANFGFHELITRYGIERRVYTAGKNKSTLDPFQPEKAADVKKLKGHLEHIHVAFVEQVKSRRGDKIAKSGDLFTGDFWIGSKAVELGLADGVGHMVPKMKEVYGSDVIFLEYSRRRALLQRFGMSMANQVLDTVEERAAYARFGL